MQAPLFDDLPPALPAGFAYEADFLASDEEAALLAWISEQPLTAARYKGYTARRHVLSYGGSYDFDDLALRPAPEIPAALQPLRDRAAHWLGVRPEALRHALVAQYPPGAPLGWHRDVPDFEQVVGISLGGVATLRFRPYPPEAARRHDVIAVSVAPRSIYRLTGEARWAWQHSVPPVQALRHSITFRTLRR